MLISGGANPGVNFTMTANQATGTVLSSQGGNVGIGANVTIAGIPGTTDINGIYSIFRVPAGNQAVGISQAGYSNFNGSVNVQMGVTSANFTMLPTR